MAEEVAAAAAEMPATEIAKSATETAATEVAKPAAAADTGDKARGPDGKFAPKPAEPPAWSEYAKGIKDEKARGAAERYASVEDMAKAHLELRQKVSSREGFVRLPYEGMTEEETTAWRKATGVPDAPEAYAIELPEGVLASDEDRAWFGGVLKAAHDAGVPRAGLESVIGAYFERVAAQEKAMASALQAQKDAGHTELRQLWGADYEANLALSQRVAARYGSPEFQQLIEFVGLADHPAVVRFMTNVGRFVGKHDPLVQHSGEAIAESHEAILEEGKKRRDEGTYYDPKFQARLKASYERRYPAGAQAA